MSDPEDRYRESLERRGLADVQPLYRALLKRLKSADPAAYEQAVIRYRASVEPACEDPGTDPLEAWLAYGRWLAERVSPGELMAVGPDGRADPVRGDEPPAGALLLHLPRDRKERAICLGIPAEPTDPQRETAELLCG